MTRGTRVVVSLAVSFAFFIYALVVGMTKMDQVKTAYAAGGIPATATLWWLSISFLSAGVALGGLIAGIALLAYFRLQDSGKLPASDTHQS